MSKIFLSTHGKMASGMKSSIEVLLGNCEVLTVYDAYVDGKEDTLKEEVESFLAACKPDESKLLISDMLGGSVNQVLSQYANHKNVFVITGITLSLLLELVTQCFDNFTKDSLENTIINAREMTKLVIMEPVISDDDFF